MKLFYYQGDFGRRNFGDELNPWLWERALPGVLNQYPDVVFLGIGTLLSKEQLPPARLRIVFGSGTGYGRELPVLDETWKVRCVRGPLTAKALGLDAGLAVTDPALLVARHAPPAGAKTSRFAYMPHWVQALRGGTDWERVCGELGMAYIDPCGPVDRVLSAVAGTEILFAEAMHGAVVADALRVPWVPVRTSPRILDFKWRDWQLSMGLDEGFREITGLIDPPVVSDQDPHGVRRWIGESLRAAAVAARGNNFRSASRQLKRIVETARPVLSAPGVSTRLGDRLEEGLRLLKDEASAGHY